MYEKMFFIAGFHRSGSTLLGSILCQNPNIHMEGKSSLCQLMWDAKESVIKNEDYLLSNNKKFFDIEYISEIPKIYYKSNIRKIVIDKNPWWTNRNNVNLIYKYIDKNFKMIVLYRNPIEVLKSYIRVYKDNHGLPNYPLINSLPEVIDNHNDFIFLINNKNNHNLLFIDYEDLVNDMPNKIKNIYDFLEIDYFQHTFDNIEKYYLQSDLFYNLHGLYEVMPKIEKRKYDIELDEVSYKICNEMNNEIIAYKELGLC